MILPPLGSNSSPCQRQAIGTGTSSPAWLIESTAWVTRQQHWKWSGARV